MSTKVAPARGRPKNEAAAIQRRDDILAAASLRFASDGYAETKVDIVAKDLDIGKGTIYLYFSSKQELFLAAVEREIRRLTTTFIENKGAFEDPLDQMISDTSAYLGFFKENPHAVELIMQERAAFPGHGSRIQSGKNNPMLEPARESIQELIDDGYVRKMPLEELTEILSNLLYGIILSDTLRRDNLDLDELSRSILSVLLLGVTTKKAREEWGLNEE
jgi:AcrR family transcriptional regulator